MSMQCSSPGHTTYGTLPRWGHSATAITLCPGLEVVTVFGGCPEDEVHDKLLKDFARISETTVITFSESYCIWHCTCSGVNTISFYVVSMATVVMLHAVECSLHIVFSTQGSFFQSGCWWVWPTTASGGPMKESGRRW